jgi:hypothetical protein
MGLNIISNTFIANEFKKSRFFRKNLGLVTTVDKNGTRIYNDKDQFGLFYNSQYRATIFAQGNIGDIKFYVDHYVSGDIFAVYTSDNFEEFIFEFDRKMVSEKGLDFYLGHILKSVDEQYDERVRNNELKKLEPKSVGDPNKVVLNPGNVSYEDLKAYIQKKNADRYKNID